MAGYFTPTVIQPAIPNADMSPLQRLILGQVFEAEIGLNDDQPTFTVVEDGSAESTSVSRRCARPIHGSGRMQRTQSANDGMKPRSSFTCCSPTQRIGTTRPEESVSVDPKIVSAMKMPSA